MKRDTAARTTGRVVFITASLVCWGAEVTLVETAAALSGGDISLVCASEELLERWTKGVNESVRHRSSSSHHFLRPFLYAPWVLAAALRGRVLFVFDLYLLPVVALVTPLARLFGGSTVVHLHDSAKLNPRRRPYLWLAGLCTLVIGESGYILGQVPGNARRSLVPPPISAGVSSNSRRRSSAANGLRVGIVGQITPQKRTKEAVQAAVGTHLPLEVVLRGAPPAGAESYLQDVLRAARPLGRRFQYQGKRPASEVMDDIDCIIALNPDEPYGRVVREAQISGVIPIVANSGGASELVVDLETGLSVDPGDLTQVTAKLDWLYWHPTEREQISDQVRKLAASNDPGRIGQLTAQALWSTIKDGRQ